MKEGFYFLSPVNVIVMLAATLFLTACLDEIPIVEDLPIIGDFLDDTFGDDDVVSSSNITFTVSGGAERSLTGSAQNAVCIDGYYRSISSLTKIDSFSTGTDVEINFPGTPGTTAIFDVTDTDVSFRLRPSGSFDLTDDTGTITVDSYGDVGGRITGSFDVAVSKSFPVETATVTGTFDVTRDHDDGDYNTVEEALNSCYN